MIWSVLLQCPNTSPRLRLGKYKFDIWFSPSEVLHDSSVRLQNPLSYIYTYEPSTIPLKKRNSGSCFLYAEDYYGMEKTGDATAQFLLKAIDDIGPAMMVLVP